MDEMPATHLILRNASSLSAESSEFEFEFLEEGPLSPKLLLSSNYSNPCNNFADEESAFKSSIAFPCEESDYIPNHLSDGETEVVKTSTKCTDQHCAVRQYSLNGVNSSTLNAPFSRQNGLTSSAPEANSESGDGYQINGIPSSINHQKLWGKFGNLISVDNHTDNKSCEAFPCLLLKANDHVNEGRRGTCLKSLLIRRTLDQLSPLTSYDGCQYKESFSASVMLPNSSSLLNHHVNHSPSHCKWENVSLNSAGASTPSSPSVRSTKKKSRKWAFNLDFLKKSRSPRVADEASSNHQASADSSFSDNSLNLDGVKPNQLGYFSLSAAAEEAGLNTDDTEEDCYIARNQTIDHYRAAGAASEDRFNWLINQSISANYCAGADFPAREAKILGRQQVNARMDHCRGTAVAAVEVTKCESPRQSTWSAISSSASSSPRHTDCRIRAANYTKINNRSVPMGLAGSPARSSNVGAEDQRFFTLGRPPMSPHAMLYEQKKAQEDELRSRRKSFLPYRKSIIGACFFPTST